MERGFLGCRVPVEDDNKGVELDVEFCRAVSASMLQHETDGIVFESVSWDDVASALENGDVDVFAGGRATVSGDVNDSVSYSRRY